MPGGPSLKNVKAPAEVPVLTIRRVPFFDGLSRRAFIAAITLAAASMVALAGSGNLTLPFAHITTLEGEAASKADLFDDLQVQRLLLKHNIQVHIARAGSRDLAVGNVDSFDFVFPSGQPASVLITQQRQRLGRYTTTYRPFMSPLVLATYRDYAEALRQAGVAAPQQNGRDQPLYFDLDLGRFLQLGRDHVPWTALGVRTHLTNGNTILAQTSSVCASNSAATYLGMVAYQTLGSAPASESQAETIAKQLKPLLREQGLSSTAPADVYLSPEGHNIAPISAIYEHQYLAHQLQFQEQHGELDTNRVLLYPRAAFQTQPELIALNSKGDQLGQLLQNDPELRRREMELGYRLLDPSGTNSSDRLSDFLAAHSVPVPTDTSHTTAARLPEVPELEKMISIVGECPAKGN